MIGLFREIEGVLYTLIINKINRQTKEINKVVLEDRIHIEFYHIVLVIWLSITLLLLALGKVKWIGRVVQWFNAIMAGALCALLIILYLFFGD